MTRTHYPPESYTAIANSLFAKGDKGFCVPLAVSVHAGVPAEQVIAKAQSGGLRKRRRGMLHENTIKLYELFGIKIMKVHSGHITKFKTVRTLQRYIDSLPNPSGINLHVRVRGHALAIKEGQTVDWTAGRLHRVRELWRINHMDSM